MELIAVNVEIPRCGAPLGRVAAAAQIKRAEAPANVKTIGTLIKSCIGKSKIIPAPGARGPNIERELVPCAQHPVGKLDVRVPHGCNACGYRRSPAIAREPIDIDLV